MTDFTGQTFDRYYILASLGEGGMASVYKAYDTRLERDVAVKIIRTDMFMPSALHKVMIRFEREAKSLAKLSHPNIVSIIDYGEHEGVPYLVMEYLPGGTIKDRLTGQPMPWQDAFRLLLPIVRALQFSHGQGIIHRDVKPSNILITLSGEPMLSDFGIARILESEGSTALTGTGVGIGTPEYMAPEQWTGDTSPQSDLYSLGVVLYEMITGRKPYTAETPAAILLKQANEPLPRPKKFVPDLPDRVEKSILKALAKKPDDRHQSMQEFSTSLEALLSGQTKIKQPVLPWGKRKEEKTPRPEHEIPPWQEEIGDQPTVEARLPAEGKVSEPVFQATESEKTEIASSETPPPMLETPRPSPGEPVDEEKTIQPGAPPRARINIRPVWIIALAGLLGLAAVIAFALWGMRRLAAGLAPVTVSSGYVFFTSSQSDKAEVWYMDSKGLAVQYTHTPGQFESWSPVPGAGGYVYFTSNQSDKAEVWYMDPKGLAVQYTHTPGPYESWSPAPAAGGVVYFTSDQSGKAEVYYLDPEGKIVQFTHTPDPYESWSPAPAAGGVVYFTSDQSGKAEVWYMDQKGSAVQYTHTPDPFESWSPAPAAGGVVYFTSNQSGKAEVWYMDPKGLAVQYTHTPGQYESWSPVPASGGVVYVTSNQSGKVEVYYLDSKGKLVSFTHTPGRYQSWMRMIGKTSANYQP